jgi:acetyltransferase-like isoleucine patch superfamily enzyme
MKWLKEIRQKFRYFKKTTYAKKQFKGAALGKNVCALSELRAVNPKYMEIGDDCFFGRNCRIEAYDEYAGKRYKPVIKFGKDVRIHSDCHIGAINRVEIGSQTLLGSHVMIIDHSHGKNSPEEMHIHPSERELYSKGEVIIGQRCWICENAVILPGVHIGDEVVIGANSVVTKNIPSRCVAAGNPAVAVKKI